MRSGDQLSARQREILSCIEDFVHEHGYPPAIREIQDKLDISSTSVVAYNLRALENKGLIDRDGKVSRGIKLKQMTPMPLNRAGAGQVPLLGVITAGQPLPNPEDTSETAELIDIPADVASPEKLQHVYALRVNLAPLPRSALPGWVAVARSVPFFLLPFAILIGTLVFTSYTLAYAAVFATVVTWVTLVFEPDGRLSLAGWGRRTLVAVVTAAQQVAIIAAVIVCAGIVVGVFNMTGLGVKLTSLILSASSGQLWVALLLTALAALVLGMELPTTAAYVICAAVAAPALVGMGLPELYAHLFVFWYALLCTITPPVCGNVFIAAGIAQTPWLPVAGNAMRLGVGLFIVPLGFVANPALLELATAPFAALATMAQIALGLWLISFAVIGAARRPVWEWLRLPALPAGLAVIFLL